ncbi:MAG: RNA polymerase factor sigma-54 [Spirochaetes bacterium]|nr:RNA polymerase factor sigma-54 [Spirochaetota bacterium]
MKQQQHIGPYQHQKMIMSPYLHKIIEILQLPLINLEQRIYNEITENPMLEAEYDSLEDATDDFNEIDTAKQEELLKYFEDTSDLGYYSSYQFDGNKEKKHDFIEKTLTRPPTLQEHLVWQLRLSTVNPDDFRIGESIISNIDQRGYLACSPEEIARGLSCSVQGVEKVLHIIQTFEPYGTGCRDLRECLMIQIKYLPQKDEWALPVVDKYFDLLTKRQYSRIARKLGVPLETLKRSLKIIKKLNPYPGEGYEVKKSEYVVPDVMVEKVNDKFIIVLNDEWIPRLRINQRYKNMLKNKGTSQKLRKYLKDKFMQAILFMKSIEQRRTTIYRVTETLAKIQSEFFDQGPQGIKSLTLKTIAQKIGMHESTVSRVTSNKFIQTPWGVYELKYFFSSSLRTIEDNKEVASKKVMEMIKTIIINEDKKNPYADDIIVDIIKKEGIIISRRTVAKYRKKLGILPSNLRKLK